MTTPTQLFSRILSLAIQGQLVSNQADDTVDDLLKEIAANNSARKKSKYEPISDDQIPFAIPDNWKWVRLGEIAFVTKLAGFEYTKYIVENLTDETGVPLFKGKNIQNGEIIYKFEAYIPKEISDLLIRSQINRKCLLTPYVGTIGNIGIHDKEGVFHLGSNVGKIELLQPNNKIIMLEEFLLSFLRSKQGYSQLTKHKKATAQESISIEAIRDVLLPLPPLSVQSRIVSKLNEIKALVDECSKIEKDLDKSADLLKAKVLDKAIRGLLTTQLPSDGDAQTLIDQIEAEKAKSSAKNKKYIPPQPVSPDDAPFKIPNNWKWVRACEVFESMESRKPTGEIFKYIDIDAIDNKANKYVAKEVLTINAPSRASRKTQKGDVLFSMVRPYLKNITIVEEDDCIASTGFYVCRSKAYYPYFLLYLMLSNYVVDGLNVYMKGDNSPSINSDNILNFLIPLPPLAEQKRIVSKLEEIFEKIEKLRV